MAGVVPPRSYLGDDLILEIAELLPGPDLIAPPLVPGAFSLDILFAFSLRPAIHSLHAFVINSFFRPFSFRPVSEAELVRIRQAVRALADVFWAVFVGRSSLCMVHGGRVNPDRWPDVVIPAQAASMLRIFESILDHFGYYLPDGTESPETDRSARFAGNTRVTPRPATCVLITSPPVLFFKFGPASFGRYRPMSLQFCLLHETPSQAVTPAQRRWNLVSVQVDIGSVDSLEEYLHRPGVVLYCREVLIPLRDIILVLDQHVTLSEAPMASPSWVRHRTAMFILLLSRVQDYVEPLRGAAPGSRVPTPSYAALDFIGKVILRYGLEGDHVPGVRLAADTTLRSVIGHVSDVAWGMSARHAEISRTRAGRSPLKAVSLDPEIAGVHALIRRRIYSRNLKSFFVMDSSLVEYRPVDALAAPSEQLMRVIIERARVNPLASSYVNSPDGLGRFFQDFYRPLATALNNAFPGSAAFPTDVPVATREAMIPFVGKLFEWSIIAYQICTQIAAYSQTPLSAPSEIIFSLRLTQKFHLLCGCPNYGGSRGQEQEKHRCISHLTRLAQSSRTSSTDPIDYVERYGIHSPSTGSFLLPHVPCWTAETIRTFLISEKNAPAVGEIELLEERIMEFNREVHSSLKFCRDVGLKAALLFKSRARSRSPHSQSCKRMSARPSDALFAKLHRVLPPVPGISSLQGVESMWCTHVRYLAQALFEVAQLGPSVSIDKKLLLVYREGVRLLLTNMIILGTTKVYQAPTPFDLSQYYVPPTATISFAIAEFLVIWGGFLHDENEPNRASVFDAVSRVQEIMIRRPGYLAAPIDVPGFGGTVIPSVVGVGFDTKEAQLHGLSERGRRRNFGEGISRYPLEEGEVPYFIPAIKPEVQLDLSSASPPSR
ncbi:hypothetical protein C8F01DRAFT_1085473 [Mycena amicta]|nr:hypothetical protein C8F01DRAFT_1085473 [Mycena amicta]